jgi:exodeoxyribonuclease VII large subunit
MDDLFTPLERRIYTVSELTHSIKSLLEDSYPFVWVAGEISNFRVPASGHFYFTLKDAEAQINAVMFRGQNRFLKFEPVDGIEVIAMGRITVFEPRGTYQIILELMEPKGIGALQLAFEHLKQKLSREGLFDEIHKRPLPFLPERIGVVTSPTGSVIRDIINVAQRRFDNTNLIIAPVRVQGDGADKEIVRALAVLNERDDVDAIILARGGGSLEDLQPFNTEAVARAIFQSHIPVVSAVGHETDYTIADFVADLRAPTPSAAAELVVPRKGDLLARALEMTEALRVSLLDKIKGIREHIYHLSKRLSDPRKEIANMRLRVDDNLSRIIYAFSSDIRNARDARIVWVERFYQCMQHGLAYNRSKLQAVTGKLDSLSPLSTLSRGYSIALSLPEYKVIKDVGVVSLGQEVEVIVARGKMVCRVEKRLGNSDLEDNAHTAK